MSTSHELSCFDCPLVCEIANQLERSNAVREETLDESVHAMGEFAEIEATDGDPTEIRSRWQHTSAEIFALLDGADKTLNTNRIGLLETCEDHRPALVDADETNEATDLRCSSALAEQVMLVLGMKVADTL